MPKPSKKEKINQKQIRECICTFWEMGDFQKTMKSKNIKTNSNWREGTTILVLWLDASLSSHCSYQQQLGPESSRGLRTSLELHLRMTIFKPEWEIYTKKKKMLSFKIYPFFFLDWSITLMTLPNRLKRFIWEPRAPPPWQLGLNLSESAIRSLGIVSPSTARKQLKVIFFLCFPGNQTRRWSCY